VVEDRGTLTLALRNGDDEVPANKGGPRTLPDLLGVEPPEEPFTTEIYRRGRLTAVAFHEGERQVIFEETPYGMPVGTQPRGRPETTEVTFTGPSSASAANEMSDPPESASPVGDRQRTSLDGSVARPFTSN
jgi:hypothetical protein